jgi:hypothetical protein
MIIFGSRPNVMFEASGKMNIDIAISVGSTSISGLLRLG